MNLIVLVLLLFFIMTSLSLKSKYKTISWKTISIFAKKLIPSLSFDKYKGQNGRVAIIGGSFEYTGAPYYAGMASLRFGADLAFVFSSEAASGPIKGYSPELMVVPFYKESDIVLLHDNKDENEYNKKVNSLAKTVIDSFPRIHSLVIGPGLGRSLPVLDIVSVIIKDAVTRNIPMVIDADGLFLITQKLSIIKGYNKCILTPNAAEFERLLASVISDISDTDSKILSDLQSEDLERKVLGVSKYLGVTVIRKGEYDIISNGKDAFIIEEQGSPRRCGGQGDILAGNLGVAISWAYKESSLLPSNEEINVSLNSNNSNNTCDFSIEPHIWTSILALAVTKKASNLAFNKFKRSMTSPDVLQHLGEAFEECYNS
jgi:ATP-dependent NAD(P)H-hydrate dehydratase